MYIPVGSYSSIPKGGLRYDVVIAVMLPVTIIFDDISRSYIYVLFLQNEVCITQF